MQQKDAPSRERLDVVYDPKLLRFVTPSSGRPLYFEACLHFNGGDFVDSEGSYARYAG
jgi:hypothetical protein